MALWSCLERRLTNVVMYVCMYVKLNNEENFWFLKTTSEKWSLGHENQTKQNKTKTLFYGTIIFIFWCQKRPWKHENLEKIWPVFKKKL